jgi:AcrR family transcriptional regulator
MTEVKNPRRYESPRRREQAAETRERILDAARRLFEANGYAATSMNAIAAEAGVALKTVYVAFESKSGLLHALWHALLRGDAGAAPVGERSWYREVLDEPDPARQLRLNARNSRIVKERVAALMEVLEAAAPADPEIQALWTRITSEFYENQRAIVRSLRRKHALKPGLGVTRATDIVWALNQPGLYRLLVRDRGWSPARYEEWLGETFCSQVLDPAQQRARSGVHTGLVTRKAPDPGPLLSSPAPNRAARSTRARRG